MENEYVKHGAGGVPMNIEDRSDPATDSGSKVYEIHVKGHLDNTWSQWLEGLEVKLLENGEMILYGPIVDQAALISVINKLARLNLTLLSLYEANRKE
jgi:hypothetical protein